MPVFDGKVALVSGSGRGIGREIALKLAREGARVIVNDLDEEPAAETVAGIEAAGGEAKPCVGSVTASGFAERFVQTAVDSFGRLDIIINNAGYTWDGVIQKMSDQQWDDIIDVHLKAPFQILRAAQPFIRDAAKKESDCGIVACRKVVNISSIAGIIGNAGQVNYAAAKAGVIGLTKTLAKEWGRYNVTVNAVAFGLISTRLTVQASQESVGGGGKSGAIEVAGREITVGVNPDLLASMRATIPLGRVGSPDDAAGAVYLLCRPESDYISGQTIVCAGGL
jgi:3-oxoacyl-[acyl-carrier protein] reductase